MLERETGQGIKWLPKRPPDGGAKHDTGKSRVDLLPGAPLLQVGDVMADGISEYGIRNWEKGISWTRCFGSALRHMLKWVAGEDCDAKSGRHHLACAVCQLLFLLEYDRTHPELDDRTENRVKGFPA